jgi:hypothetical protein
MTYSSAFKKIIKQFGEKRMKKVLAMLIAVFALNAVPVVYADEPASEAISAEALPEGVAPLPDFVPAE